MTIPMAVWAVKRTAFIIMIAPTGTLVFRAARLTIHPLWDGDRDINRHLKHEGGNYALISFVVSALCSKRDAAELIRQADARRRFIATLPCRV